MQHSDVSGLPKLRFIINMITSELYKTEGANESVKRMAMI